MSGWLITPTARLWRTARIRARQRGEATRSSRVTGPACNNRIGTGKSKIRCWTMCIEKRVVS